MKLFVKKYQVKCSNFSCCPGAAETELLTHVTDNQALEDYDNWKQSMGGTTMSPQVVAQSVKFIYDMPQEVNIRELDIAATNQDS